MHVGLNVGLSSANYSMRTILDSNSARLAQRGWEVAAESHDDLPPEAISSDYRLAAEQTIEGWLEWLPTCDADGALLSCVHLADALLVSGQARQLVTAARSSGELACCALVRRFDEYVALRYTTDLLGGRGRPLQEPELAGRGVNNYLARLAKWQEAAESDFTAILARTDQPEDQAVLRLLVTLGVPDPADLHLPEPNRAERLDSHGAEVLRRLNRLLDTDDVDKSRADEMRSAAVATLTATQPVRAFRIPADSALALLRTFAGPAAELSRAMSADDRAHYLSQDVPDDERIDESEVTDRLKELADELGIETDVKAQSSAAPTAKRRVRQMAQRARVARTEGDLQTYRRLARRIRNTIPELPEYRARGFEPGEPSRIPRRVIQFWDPAPPPDEMLPWMNSWEGVGLPQGHHLVASYQQGLAAVQDVAGELGREAYEAAPHAAIRADLFRYAELFERGGWYVDAEHEALLPLEDVLLWPVDHVLLVRPGKDRIVNNFIGAVPGSALMKAALIKGCQNLLEQTSGSVVDMTGPAMLTGLVREYEQSPDASFVIVPSNVVFGGAMQVVHNQAEYKIHGHWRYTELSSD